MPDSRQGFTLLELLVATGTVQQQRALGKQMDVLAGRAELRLTAESLPAELRELVPGSSDIQRGEAGDTSIQLRGTIGAAIVCDTLKQRVVLAPATSAPPLVASFLRAPVATDTLWVLDTTRAWSAHIITSVQIVSTGACRLGGPAPTPTSAADRYSLGIADAAIPPPGRAVRVTRPIRYSLYKSSDKLWYLGARDWNSTSHQFNTIQPVSGPFMAPAAHGLTFAYLDSSGATIATPVTSVERITAIRVTLVAARRFEFGEAPGTGSADTETTLVRLRGGGP